MLPTTERLLLGPGPSPVSARVMRAMSAPSRSHLDPELVALLDDIRVRLLRVFRADADSVALAVSGTGTSAMECAVANLVAPSCRALVVVNGYFGDRLAQMCARYGATVTRLDGEWGRAVDPAVVESALKHSRADVVAVVHGETSTGVRNPVDVIARIAHDHDALAIVDAVASLGAVPVEIGAWGVDACYSCSQKGLGAPSGLSPIVFSARALSRRVPCRSFYLDLALLQQFWIERKYHHTISAPLVYALDEALAEVEDEGLQQRWARHEETHRAFLSGLDERGWSLLPPESDRLWSLNTVNVPGGVNDVSVRTALRDRHQIEIGAGLGPFAGTIWRVGLMGYGATTVNVSRLFDALDAEHGREPDALLMRLLARIVVAVIVFGWATIVYAWMFEPDVRVLKTQPPGETSFMRIRAAEAAAKGRSTKRIQRWVSYDRISPNLRRAILAAEDGAFYDHEGIDWFEVRASIDDTLHKGEELRGASTITQQLAKNLYLSPSRNPYRKLSELFITRKLEADLSKRRILEIYLNVIEWGDGIWGCEAASEAYFGMPAADLSLDQAAMLAAAVSSPRVFNPAHPSPRLLKAQQVVLRRLNPVPR